MERNMVNSAPRVINTVKKIKEEIIRFYNPVDIGDGIESELKIFPGAGTEYYTVRQGEAMELIGLGLRGNANTKRLSMQDRDGSEWNHFSVYETPGYNSNELPFNLMENFERRMMFWGYKSYLKSNKDIAPTLKLPEGDRLRLFLEAEGGTVSAGTVHGAMITRRYLPGSDVPFEHMAIVDGGLKSNKKYYNDSQMIAETEPGRWTVAWELNLLKTEGYRFFHAGIMGRAADNIHLQEAKILIDDPQFLHNMYFIHPSYNNLPWTRSYGVYVDPSASSAYTVPLEQQNRIAPTLDVVRSINKQIRIKVRDDGTKATNVHSRMVGIRMVL